MPSLLTTATHHRHHPEIASAASPQRDQVAEIAALYPSHTEAAQQLLTASAAALLNDSGHAATVGEYGIHATIEIPHLHGALVLMPMADLVDLDPEWADSDDQDPAVWHLLLRDHAGTLMEPGLGVRGCPSVVWAVRAGIDPAVARSLVSAAMADPTVRSLL